MLPTVKEKVFSTRREYLERILHEYHAYDESLDIAIASQVRTQQEQEQSL